MSSPSRIPATQIPNITELRRRLDYGDASMARCAAFYDHLRVYRKTFITKEGKPGAEVHEWKDRDAQAQLDEITAAYLDRDGNGHKFWPKDGLTPNHNSLVYSRDREKIRRLIKQLIFRLNQQQFRNHKYKRKDQNIGTSPSRRGTSIETPIDLDEEDFEDQRASPLVTPIDNHTNDSQRQHKVVKLKVKLPSDQTGMPQKVLHALKSQAEPTVRQLLHEAGVEHARSATTPDDNDNIWNFPPKTVRASQKKRPPVDRSDGRTRMKHPRRVKEIEVGEISDTVRNRSVPSLQHAGGEPQDVRNDTQSLCATAEGASVPMRSPTVSQGQNHRVSRSSNDWVLRYSEDIDLEHIRDRNQSDQVPLHTEEGLTEQNERTDSGAISAQPTTSKSPNVEEDRSDAPESSAPTLRVKALNTTNRPMAPPAQNVKDVDDEATHTASKPKSSVEIMYTLILSRSPIYEVTRWEPEGSFQQMTFAQLLGQLPFSGDVEGLMFSFEGPGLRIKESIDSTNEVAFGQMKRRFNKGILAALGNNAASVQTLVFELEIEPKREAAAISESENDVTSFF